MIYVDALFDTTWADKAKWPYARSCHLTADTEAELHEFAARLGLKRAWYQRRPRFEFCHYDLTATKRALAIKLGAIEMDAREQAQKWLAASEGASSDADA